MTDLHGPCLFMTQSEVRAGSDYVCVPTWATWNCKRKL